MRRALLTTLVLVALLGCEEPRHRLTLVNPDQAAYERAHQVEVYGR